MRIIDLRSDTITHPTPAMRKAIFEAEVGDDVYGEDPTVNRLEAMAAEIMGKEAALFTTSGTQSNLIAVLTHTKHGDEIIVGDQAHMLWYELGSAAALGGVEDEVHFGLIGGDRDAAQDLGRGAQVLERAFESGGCFSTMVKVFGFDGIAQNDAGVL